MSIEYETKWSGIHAWYRQNVRYMHPHAHDYVEVLYARGGAWTVHLNFKTYSLQKGDLLFAFPGQIHAHEAADIENIALLFPKNLPVYDGVFDRYVPASPVLHGAVDGQTDEWFLSAAAANKSDSPYAKGIAEGYIALILGRLLPLLPLMPVREHTVTKEERIIRYCSAHYHEPISLPSAAEALGYSPSHLSHLFKNKFQINFAKFITLMRIEDAKKMLRGANPVTQIALDSGFGSMRTFDQVFKASTGMTPVQYREKHKKRPAVSERT
ncbi:MAG: helix-turn-helix transcriptional regulator [Clostridia bacterium]|nr:helix-turn-helix transcriptional regulator [Clostridia bacterium]